jgi:hypothetical protein
MDIFDLVFNTFMAFNQLGFLLGGLFCLLIALALLGDAIYTRVAGNRVKGRVVGIRAVGIKDPDKEISEAEAASVKPALDEVKQSFKQAFFEQPVRSLFTGFFILLFALMPFTFFGIGAYFAYDYASLKMTGIEAPARITENKSSTDSDGSTSYYAVVSFTDQNGYYHTVKDKIGKGGSPSYRVGESVRVFYEARDPEHFVIDDFWHYMGFAFAFMGISSVFIGFMAFAFLGGNSSKNAKGIAHKPKSKDYKNEMYYPVYEFTMPDGQTSQFIDSTGSNMLSSNRIGKTVTVKVRDNDPDTAKKPGKIGAMFGLIMLVPGVLFTYLAFTTFEFTMMTPIVAVGGIGWMAFKAHNSGFIKPREMWENRDQFKLRMNKKKEKKQAKGRLLTVEEIIERLEAYDKSMMVGLPIGGLIAIAMMAGGVYLWNDMADKAANGLRAEGQIVRIESVSSDEGYSYYGVAAFKTEYGERIEFRDNVGSSSALFKRGDSVDILYDPEKPHKAIIDRGLWNWAPGVGLVLLGLLALWSTARTFFNIRARRRRL